MNKPIWLTLLVLSFNFADGQSITEDIIGEKITIQSEVLQEPRALHVYLPDSYQETSKEYPVLYVLDGQRFFFHAISVAKLSKKFSYTPEHIVVGVENVYPKRFSLFNSHAEYFKKFLVSEAMDFVDKNYRTESSNILFGWEYGGGFTLQMMKDEPELFDAYIAASPYPINESRLPNGDDRLRHLDTLSSNDSYQQYLYFASAIEETNVKSGTDDLNQMLQSKDLENIRWDYTVLENEDHHSTPFSTLYHGLRNYYFNYPEPKFSNVEEFYQKGGMNYLNRYFIERGKRFGFDSAISKTTMQNLIIKAWDKRDFKNFDYFFGLFEKDGVLEIGRVNWLCEFANFYFDNEHIQKALEIYEFANKKYPNSARPLHGIGMVYKKRDRKKRARDYFEQAIDLGTKNSDWRLNEYQASLNSVAQ